MLSLIKKIIGTKNERDIRAMRSLVARINAIEADLQKMTDDQVRSRTAQFKEMLAAGKTTDDILCDAFATVKNAARRLAGTRYQVCNHDAVWEMVHFDVQLMGGIVLHQGKIAEMATGEGKTLVATLPVYLNALTGKGVHMVTVNDYLARRDAQWMAPLYQFLGITVGCIQNTMHSEERRDQYACDVTYGTNAEFGFDYLRDNGLAMFHGEQVQRGYAFAIIDEADNILIDEARTPLIISGAVAGDESSKVYIELKPRAERLVKMQRELCNSLVTKAKAHLDKGETEDAEILLYQIHQGMPKHKQLMHILEEPANRKLLEHVESIMLTDMRKDMARELKEDLYFVIDEKGRDITLTDKGCAALNPAEPDTYILPDMVSAMSDIDGAANMSDEQKAAKRLEIQNTFTDRSSKIHAVDQLIRAFCMYDKDVEYVVQDNRVLIVDEFTGRILPGRRWSDGLHQAVEAKEGVQIERETQTLATITIQNYFRMYAKLAGMTGTAETEASEFRETYKLDVTVMPTNRPVRRMDYHDQIFKTQREKYKAIIEDIRERYAKGQPILVGTVSVDSSELLSRMLKREKIPHNVLNAKNHEREAEIVARAGQAGSVTIATNMAGRGTDIKLGEGVVYLPREIVKSDATLDSRIDDRTTLREKLFENPCGLYVLGSERHEARRIDRQLRGRCARQGDPGSSRFYVSLEDDLMRMFGSDRIGGLLSRLGLEEGQVLEHKWLNKSIETAQKRVEQHNFSIRKRTLEYDDVMNKQREIIYGFRGNIVRSASVREDLLDIIYDVISSRAEDIDGAKAEDKETAAQGLTDWIRMTFPVNIKSADLAGMTAEQVADTVFEKIKAAYELKIKAEDPVSIVDMERYIVLRAIDSRWQDFLRSMDSLREGVGLRAYGQRDPLVEYKREAFGMFETLMSDIKDEIAGQVFRASTSLNAMQAFITSLPQNFIHDEVAVFGSGHGRSQQARPAQTETVSSAGSEPDAVEQALKTVNPIRRDNPKVGRNDPCPCGSGKKFKKCCGAGAG